MNLNNKRELLETMQPKYLKANKLEKQKVPNKISTVTRYHRKHSIRVLIESCASKKLSYRENQILQNQLS